MLVLLVARRRPSERVELWLVAVPRMAYVSVTLTVHPFLYRPNVGNLEKRDPVV